MDTIDNLKTTPLAERLTESSAQCTINSFPPFLLYPERDHQFDIAAGARLDPACGLEPIDKCRTIEVGRLFTADEVTFVVSGDVALRIHQSTNSSDPSHVAYAYLEGQLPQVSVDSVFKISITAENKFGRAVLPVTINLRVTPP